jgi:hypothetical protein
VALVVALVRADTQAVAVVLVATLPLRAHLAAAVLQLV